MAPYFNSLFSKQCLLVVVTIPSDLVCGTNSCQSYRVFEPPFGLLRIFLRPDVHFGWFKVCLRRRRTFLADRRQPCSRHKYPIFCNKCTGFWVKKERLLQARKAKHYRPPALWPDPALFYIPFCCTHKMVNHLQP